MYKLSMIPLPKGRKLNEYINEIYTTHEVEEAKDMIFRLTYPYALTELKKHQNMTTIEDGLGDMSVAFIKTFNNYDPTREDGSFMNYYKISIKREVINTVFRKYRASKEKTALCILFENGLTSLDEPVQNKDEVDTGTKGELIASSFDLDDEVISNDIKERLLDLTRQAVRENIKFPKQIPAHEKVMLYYAQTCMDGDPADARRVEKELGVKDHTARRIINRYKNQMFELWEGEKEYVK